MNVSFSNDVLKYFKITQKENPKLLKKIHKQLLLFKENPRHLSLRTHKLAGKLSHSWSISIEGNIRMLYYISHDDSPSFLMRLEGNLGNSTYGIESLVNLEEFQQQGLAIKDRSIVDYIYFGTKSTINYRVNNTPSWFKIDGGHLDTYQVTNITI